MCDLRLTVPKSSESVVIRRAAIERKTRALGLAVSSGPVLDFWMHQLDQQIDKLNSHQFRALVMDCDGTLWNAREEISEDTLTSIDALLQNGILIGIATGRDATIAAKVKQVFHPDFHQNIWMACGNGEQVFRLGEAPETSNGPCPELEAIRKAIEGDLFVGRLVKCTSSFHQLTIGCDRSFSRDTLLRFANTYCSGVRGIRVVASSNSVDILAPDASKLNIAKPLEQLGILRDEILFIGDQGNWPGNDFEMLSQPYSLSTDEPSCCSSCGWNLAPESVRGPEATAFYLRCSFTTAVGCFRLALPHPRDVPSLVSQEKDPFSNNCRSGPIGVME